MTVPNKWQRQISRAIHLMAGSVLGLATYGPPEVTQWLQLIMQVAVFPALVLTGMWLWMAYVF